MKAALLCDEVNVPCIGGVLIDAFKLQSGQWNATTFGPGMRSASTIRSFFPISPSLLCIDDREEWINTSH